MKKQKELARIVTKGNKLYLKLKIGDAPERTYRFKPEIPLQLYKQEYINTEILKKQRRANIRQLERATKLYKESKKVKPETAIKISKKTQSRINYIKKHPKLQKIIRKGRVSTTIPNILTATKEQIQRKIEIMMSKLIADKEITKLVCKEENLAKMQHRFLYKLKLIGTDGATVNAVKGAETPQKTARLLDKISEGEEINADYGTGGMRQKLEDTKWKNITTQGDGRLKAAQLTIIFTKGK